MSLIKKIIIFFGTFMLYHILFSSFFPVDENNVLQAPDWYTYLGLSISVIAALFFTIKKKRLKTHNSSSNPDSIISYIRGIYQEPLIEPAINPRPQASPTPVTYPLNSDSSRSIDVDLSFIDHMEGHDFEYWCARLLSDIGFSTVEVTPGSGDQRVDVVAVKDGIRYAVQCKCYSKDLGNGSVQEVNAGKSMPQYHCQIGAVMTNCYFTKGAKELADATGTLLWDRDWIKSQLLVRSGRK